jgi:hypothetical protein
MKTLTFKVYERVVVFESKKDAEAHRRDLDNRFFDIIAYKTPRGALSIWKDNTHTIFDENFQLIKPDKKKGK